MTTATSITMACCYIFSINLSDRRRHSISDRDQIAGIRIRRAISHLKLILLNAGLLLALALPATAQTNEETATEQTETEIILLPLKSPNLNAYLERYMRSLKSECLGCLILFGHKSLELALKEYVAHYHSERNHQGLNNELIAPDEVVGTVAGEIKNRERLGGLFNYYYRDAA